MSRNPHFPLPDNMPPLPKAGEYGSQVCSAVRFYLAILDDLPPEQVQILLAHARACADCAAMQHLMQRTTAMVARLPETAPSKRVDQAVMAAIAAHATAQPQGDRQGQEREGLKRAPLREASGSYIRARPQHPRIATKRHRSIVGATLALTAVTLAAVLLLTFVTTIHFLGGSPQAFTLPPDLSWAGYVLYHSETRIDERGERYHVNSYHDLGKGRMHVETIMPGSLDVVAVGDEHTMLGLDMMHHVAQWGANEWSVDETAFNLPQLRKDMDEKRAVYLDKDVFHEQPVYRIRCRNGLVLLLNMDYEPVNVLRGAVGPGTGEPVYDSLVLMPTSHVSSSMWDMSVPSGFQMGTLPKKPR